MNEYETPKQYKKRTNKDWPGDAPVWCLFIICWKGLTKGRKNWHLRTFAVTKYIPKLYGIVIANEKGKPPSDYRPEE